MDCIIVTQDGDKLTWWLNFGVHKMELILFQQGLFYM